MKYEYELYWLPKRVVEEYKLNIKNGEVYTPPIIRRKISAMIYATMYKREQINSNTFKHVFDNVEIIVEENNKIISKISYKLEHDIKKSDARFYSNLCRHFGLNDKHNNFSPVYLSKGI